MKKVLLSLAFVLATGSLLNANNIEEDVVVAKMDCINFAFAWEKIHGNMTFEQFDQFVQTCESFNN